MAEVIAHQLLGEAGTPIKFTIQRKGVPGPLDITVIREPLPAGTDGAAHPSSTHRVLPCTLAVTPTIKKPFQGTDAIEIRQVTGTVASFEVGGIYRVTGVCRQQTLKHAALYVGNTATSGADAIAPVDGSSLYKSLSDGSTEFDVTFVLLRPGVLHVTIYDLDHDDKNDNAYAGISLGEVVQP